VIQKLPSRCSFRVTGFISRSFRPTACRGLCRASGRRSWGVGRRLYQWSREMIYAAGECRPIVPVVGTSAVPDHLCRSGFTTEMLHCPTTNYTVDIVLAVLLLIGGVIAHSSWPPPLGPSSRRTAAHPVGAFWSDRCGKAGAGLCAKPLNLPLGSNHIRWRALNRCSPTAASRSLRSPRSNRFG